MYNVDVPVSLITNVLISCTYYFWVDPVPHLELEQIYSLNYYCIASAGQNSVGPDVRGAYISAAVQ
jgi:hypothetical protein